MALALNVFQTVTFVAPTNPVGILHSTCWIYWCCIISTSCERGFCYKKVSLSHVRTTAGIAVTTEIVKDLPIESSDTANLLAGKLVLETNDVLKIICRYCN